MKHLYHYTDSSGLDQILKDGEISPSTIKATKDLMPTEESEWLTIGPIVWLTINPIMDGTVLHKLCGRDPSKLCRVVLPYLCDTGLGEYCDQHGVDPSWLIPMVQTGKMVGSDYTTWRLHSEPVLKDQWLRVERGGSWLPQP